MMDLRLVHQVGARALDWIHGRREGFRPRPDHEVTRVQAVGDLALTAGAILREGAGGTRQSAVARRLLDFAWHDLLDGGACLHRLQQAEPSSPVRWSSTPRSPPAATATCWSRTSCGPPGRWSTGRP
ncbi:hypothetical protein AB0K14_17665 [Actinosynnema sp. NPDC050801]|uniref:DUF6895 family protein n=1 Tax=unclassified Actinosynnema TaxID=2637065 RepID=UPI0033E15C71